MLSKKALGATSAGKSPKTLFLAIESSPYLLAYSWGPSGGFGGQFSTPGTSFPVNSNSNAIAINPDENVVAVLGSSSPYVRAFPWSSTGFGTKYADPSVVPGGNSPYALTFSPTKGALAVVSNGGNVPDVYRWSNSTGFGTKYTAPSTLPPSESRSVAFSPDGSVIVLGHYTQPNIAAYAWSDSTGFGTKYANPSLPTGITTAYTQGVTFSPDGSVIALCMSASPNIAAYPWSNSTGFGTKYANPSSLPADATAQGGLAFSPSGNTIAVAHGSSPFLSVYPWSNSTGFGTRFTNPGDAINQGKDVAFSPDGRYLALGYLSGPVIVYPWNDSTGFGTSYANPLSGLGWTAQGVAWSTVGDPLYPEFVAVSHANTPFVTAYPWSSNGFGAKFANPATLPAGTGNGVAFNPSGNAVAVAHATTPFVTAYPWSASGFGTKFADPSTVPAGTGFGVTFSPNGSAVAVAHGTTPFITAYPWSGSGFGTKYANPTTLPASTGNGIAFTQIILT